MQIFFKILEGPMPYSNLLNIKKGYKKVQRNIIKKQSRTRGREPTGTKI